jgi:phosphoglycolate phosphatase
MTTLNNISFKTIIFDLDGTLLEGKLRHYHCYSDILRANGFIPVELERYWLMKRQRKDRYQQLVCSGAEKIYDQFLEEWIARIELQAYLKFDYLLPNVIEILTKLQQAGKQLILATMRSNEKNLFWQLEELGLKGFFPTIVAVSHQQSSTKAAALVNLIDQRRISEYLWIGDTEMDVNAARQLGVKVATVGCGLRTKDYLIGLHPDFYSSDLATCIAF